MATAFAPIPVNEANQWRLETPGADDWARTARPGEQPKKKYFMVSVDTHLMMPPTLSREMIDAKYRDRLPTMEMRDGVRYMVRPGFESQRIQEPELEGEDLVRTKAGAGHSKEYEVPAIETRLLDADRDGVDGEVIFPNGPTVLVFAGHDYEFIMAQCRVWNDWAIEFCKPHLGRLNPVALVLTGDIAMAIAEVQRVAKLGYRILSLPTRPIFGEDITKTNYNLPMYDPLWACIQDAGLPIVFHVASGKDPRAARGAGGAVINYVVHASTSGMEPLVALCASGVVERFPKLRFSSIEANAGWLPWMLDMMDEGYLKHHFWVKPKLKELPSTYFRTNGGASIGEDRSALLLIEHYKLQGNLMWANDFPHHEGSWPHSAQAIERNFRGVEEKTRAQVLGLNAARMFGFDVPADLA